MNLALDIAFAHVLKRRRQSLVSVLGVMLGVGFFIAMASMMQGFQRDFVARVIDVQPHIVIKDEFRDPPPQPADRTFAGGAVQLFGLKPRDEPRGIRNARGLIAAIQAIDGVAVAPTLTGQAFMRYGTRDVSATLIGIEPQAERRVTNLEKDMIAGTIEALQGVANGVILGEGLARKLGAGLGTTLTLVSTEGTTLKAKVVGLFRSGITSIDNFQAYALLKKAQVVQDRPNVINQLRLRLADVEQAQDLAARLEARFGYRAEPWQESNANVLGIFVIQNAIMYSTVGAILVVACFGIFNVVSTVIYEKTRDIAILKSIGFRERDIKRIFVLQGLLVGIVGTLCGWALGYGLVALLASLRFEIEGFVRTQGFILYRSPTHYLVAGGFAILSSVVAAWLPSRRAARVNPVDIVRGAA
ncbi:MAG: ABC transporter permease [Alphaproteobacteria bacterium]|nr:ABC transporter permease [Alphaproteobacteria bacterium]